MATTNRTLVMVFATDEGLKETITFNKPAQTLDASTVSAQMDAMIATNLILEGEHGMYPVTQKVSAKFVTQTKTAVDVE